MNDQKTLVLTGVCGFIGLNFLEYFFERYKNNENNFKYFLNDLSEIYIIDLFEDYYANCYNMYFFNSIIEKFKKLNVPIYLKKYDLSSSKFSKICEEIQKRNTIVDIINFASCSHVDNSIKTPQKFLLNNVSIVSNLTQIKNINYFFHISTDEVYGDIKLENIFDENYYFSTKSPLNPQNPYSASKAAQDLFLLSLKHTFNFPVKIIRLANQFGPYQHLEKFIPNAIFKVLRNKPIEIYGNGKNIRQWTPVKDSVSLICDIFQNPLNYNTIIHIGYPYKPQELFNNVQIVEFILSELKLKYNISGEFIFIKDRLGHDQAYMLKDTLPWTSLVSLKRRLSETIDWYVENRSFFLGE